MYNMFMIETIQVEGSADRGEGHLVIFQILEKKFRHGSDVISYSQKLEHYFVPARTLDRFRNRKNGITQDRYIIRVTNTILIPSNSISK